ncbi:MAG: NADH-quinone oxidoreductase subunit A [Dehalococcoidales bacterium]|nr:NADH-quinone oxidoreductase subunit A [Dehalococcoidales bacterium]
MIGDYGYIALYLIICLVFSSFIALMPQILEFVGIEKKKPSEVKYNTYECGLLTIGRSWVQYNPHYYYYALMLTAMDTSVIFIFLWAKFLSFAPVEYRPLAFGVGLAFIFIIASGFLYAWKKGVLKWK